MSTADGREDLIASALDRLAAGHSVLVCGAAGIGKSTVLRAIDEALRGRGVVPLRVSCAEADARMPFVALIDLLGRRDDKTLSPGTRRALDVALRRREAIAGEVDHLAICLATLELIRSLAQDGPLHVIIDDLQWIDPASAEVLAFVSRRLAGDWLRLLAAERVALGEAATRMRLLPDEAVELTVGPLPAEILIPRVAERSGGLVGSLAAEQICAQAGGNPLFALEIADAIRRRGVAPAAGQPLPVPVQLETLMRQRLAGLADSARETVRLAAAAHRPTATLLTKLGRVGVLQDMSAASEAGVCTLDVTGAVDFGHPLMRAAVYAEAPMIVRMGLHARLAEVATDPIERARHLALSTAVEDETVAAALTTAAALARNRGATSAARELAGLAAQRTPAQDVAARATRLLAEAEYAYATGEFGDARQVAESILTTEVPAHVRVRAALVLFDACGNGIGQLGEQIAAALRDVESIAAGAAEGAGAGAAGSMAAGAASGSAGDATLEPWVRLHAASHHRANMRHDEAIEQGRRAVRAAAAAGDVRAELRALEILLNVLSDVGQDTSEIIARGTRLCEEHDVGEASFRFELDLCRRRMYVGDFAEALKIALRVLRRGEETGSLADVGYVYFLLTRIDIKLGRCASALANAARLERAVPLSSGYRGLVLLALAEAEVIGGDPSRAVELARQTVAETEQLGDADNLMPALHTLGDCLYRTDDLAGARVELERAWEIGKSYRKGHNHVRMIMSLLAEVLVRLDDLPAAREVLAALFDPAGDPQECPPNVAALMARAEGMVLHAEGRLDLAAERFGWAAETFRGLGMQVELVRTLIEHAELERRRRRRAAARSQLDEALSVADRSVAVPLAAQVRSQLARLTPAGGQEALTPMEKRIAAMAVAGSTNKQIAGSLHIGVTTVESALTQIYRKLGIRSRVELARELHTAA